MALRWFASIKVGFESESNNETLIEDDRVQGGESVVIPVQVTYIG